MSEKDFIGTEGHIEFMENMYKDFRYENFRKNGYEMIQQLLNDFIMWLDFYSVDAFDDNIDDIEDILANVQWFQYEEREYLQFKNWGVEVFITLMTQYKEQEKKYEKLYDVIDNHYEYSLLNNVFYNLWYVDWDSD